MVWTDSVTSGKLGTKMQVLLIEGGAKDVNGGGLIICPQNFKLHHTDLGEKGLNLARLYYHHIIVIDLDLPDMCGHEVLSALRSSKINTPVIIVSKPCDVETKVKSFELGADDHIIKPIHKNEMIARLHAVARRSRSRSENTIKAGELSINLETRSVQVNGENIDLSKTEYRVLEIFALNIGKPLSRKKLSVFLYPGRRTVQYRPIDLWIFKLRKKLGEDIIQTIPGYGYGLMVQEEE